MVNDRPCLLVVDDEESIRTLLLRLLEGAGYSNILTASSGEEARRLLATHSVDLVLTDMQMETSSGLELLYYMHEAAPQIATLMVTGVDDAGLADKALALGAYGYIIKPLRKSEVVIGVNNALRRRDLELANQSHVDDLADTVKERTADLWESIVKLELSERNLRKSRSETIGRLAVAGEFRDEDTGFHVARMSRYCEVLAKEFVEGDVLTAMREASSLHDVGKIGVPDSVLLKPGPLTPEERRIMEAHAQIGYGILKESDSPLLKLAAEIALTHHEKFDGTGYPNGLVGRAIPLVGRIAGIADVFDALTSNRVYRPAFSLMDTIQMMKRDAGTHFDSELLSAFWRVLPEVLTIKDQYEPAVPALTSQEALDLADARPSGT